jgi:hypothetical protein
VNFLVDLGQRFERFGNSVTILMRACEQIDRNTAHSVNNRRPRALQEKQNEISKGEEEEKARERSYRNR